MHIEEKAPQCSTCDVAMRPAGTSHFACESCGSITSKLTFTELAWNTMKASYVNDINRLLVQLSSNAEPCTYERLDHMFSSGTRLFAALADGKIVGTVLLVPMVGLVGQKDWIEDVVVDEFYRRRNVATILMEMAHEASCERNAKSINLTSSSHRGAARNLYSAMGYELRDTGVFRLTF